MIRTLNLAFKMLVWLVVLGIFAAGFYVFESLSARPIQSVRIAGEFHNVDRSALEAAVAKSLSGGFFHLDVDEVRAAARSLPWVRDASVRRVWPDTLHVAVIERSALMRWGEGGLMESDATVFFPASGTADFGLLPRLDGPPGSEPQVLERYRELRAILAPLGSPVQRVSVTNRGSWRVVLENNFALLLGQWRDTDLIRRFAQAFPDLSAMRTEELVQVDLRYANGFSVLWREAQPVAQVGG